ncbi:MAG TPA: hypothetical protein VKY85_14210 [Candidatus Angelobacter sp.]|nr:hypothetical protein [Candidatus Angelobacter sp.]
MLAWTKEQRIPGVDDVIAYGDSESPFVFYLVSSTPRFRIGPDGSPVFQFLKYREPVPRDGGKKGGGFLICDVEFSVPSDALKKATDALQEQVNAQFPKMNPKPVVQVREITFTKGSTTVQLFDSGGAGGAGALVERLQNPGAPSLYGDLITPITVEFSAEGATLAEQALQSKGPSLQVIYSLIAPVALPKMTCTVWFSAEKMMSYTQKVDIDKGWYRPDSYKENVRQLFMSSESGGVIISADGVVDPKVRSKIEDWGFQTLDDAVKRMVLGDIPDVSPDDRKVPDGIDHLDRSIAVTKLASFSRTLTEGMTIEVDLGPRGSLPGISTLTDKDGKPLQWKDFARTVDLNDPFFQQININIRANADFNSLPIFSIDGQISYDEGSTHASQAFTLNNPNDVVKFASFTENNKRAYSYNYKVNYKGETRTFDSGTILSKGDEPLTIDVGDTGVLVANVQAGDINFDEVTQALVTVHYEDPSNNVDPVEWEMTLDKDHKAQTFQKVIFATRNASFKYKVKYDMKDGKTYLVDWKTNPASQIYVGSPFGGRKTLHLRAIGDLQSDVSTIFLDVKYVDTSNNYNQSNSVALSKATPFIDWTFPVIDDSVGTVTYSGSIQFMDGTVQNIAETTATKDTILVGRAKDDTEFLSVSLPPDLLDFTKLKLVKVALHYVDADHDMNSTKDFIITKATSNAPVWTLRLQDKTKRSYDYRASFFMLDGTSKSIGPITTDEPILLLEMPAAAAGA